MSVVDITGIAASFSNDVESHTWNTEVIMPESLTFKALKQGNLPNRFPDAGVKIAWSRPYNTLTVLIRFYQPQHRRGNFSTSFEEWQNAIRLMFNVPAE